MNLNLNIYEAAGSFLIPVSCVSFTCPSLTNTHEYSLCNECVVFTELNVGYINLKAADCQQSSKGNELRFARAFRLDGFGLAIC